jgi:hypothetical protein
LAYGVAVRGLHVSELTSLVRKGASTMDIQLKGKPVLVTGGNSGIGEPIALAFADAGAFVPINEVTNEPAAKQPVQTTDRASYVTATTVFFDGGMTDYPSFAQGG